LSVEKRQKLVLQTAIKSDAIISSLFPTTVKDRLYNATSQHNLGAATEDAEGLGFAAAYEMPITDGNGGGGVKWRSGVGSEKEPPIAELYETSTILFAGTYYFHDVLF
jgi:hypothetical protein